MKYFYITASCYSRQAYLTTYRPNLMPSDEEVRRKVEYAFDSLRVKDENQIYGPSNKTIVLEYPRSEEKTTQKKLVIGSCRLLDNKLEKPTTFEIVLPVIHASFRKTTASNATTPKEWQLQARKRPSSSPTRPKTQTRSSYFPPHLDKHSGPRRHGPVALTQRRDKVLRRFCEGRRYGCPIFRADP